jgi:hypothetical protein
MYKIEQYVADHKGNKVLTWTLDKVYTRKGNAIRYAQRQAIRLSSGIKHANGTETYIASWAIRRIES